MGPRLCPQVRFDRYRLYHPAKDCQRKRQKISPSLQDRYSRIVGLPQTCIIRSKFILFAPRVDFLTPMFLGHSVPAELAVNFSENSQLKQLRHPSSYGSGQASFPRPASAKIDSVAQRTNLSLTINACLRMRVMVKKQRPSQFFARRKKISSPLTRPPDVLK